MIFFPSVEMQGAKCEVESHMFISPGVQSANREVCSLKSFFFKKNIFFIPIHTIELFPALVFSFFIALGTKL